MSEHDLLCAMFKPEKNLDPCYQCGWLGMCTIACPLADPARQISPTISTAPELDPTLADSAFEIVAAEKPDLDPPA